MKATREDLRHVLDMVLLDNKGSMLTEALVIGIGQSILMYIGNIEAGGQDGLAAEQKAEG
jgi:hypothetical protein